MKSYFPFTDYDFYGYITSGFLILLTLDYVFMNATILLRDEWTFIEIVIAVALAYVTGHLAASPSSLLLEHGIARRLLSPPLAVQTGLKVQGRIERFVGSYLIGRYYAPLPADVRARVLERVGQELGLPTNKVADSESVFHVGFNMARADEDARNRLEVFRNQYGFTRNMAFAGLLSAVVIGADILVYKSDKDLVWALFALVVGTGMLVRFLKFYAAYANEVIRPLIKS